MRLFLAVFAVVALLSACVASSALGEQAGVGPNPTLAEPNPELIPTVHAAKATGWPTGAKPVAAQGFAVTEYASGLDHPRWVYVLPNGDVLVAESNKPRRIKEKGGIRAFFAKMTMKKAGAGVESADRITLLRDADNDGKAELKTSFLENLHSPFGMALVEGNLYVANADAVVRFPYKDGETQITAEGTKLADLPAGINHHWTKSLVASDDGKTLYVGVGSNSNIGENGMEIEENRAAILEINRETGETKPFATGLRNPVGMDWNPVTKELWTAVNERDELGPDLVPDYMTSVKKGAFYGWPYSYFGKNVDERVEPQRPELVEKAIAPDYGLGAHTASLGLAFYDGKSFPARYINGVFIGQHGSWNRKPRSGYKVVFIPFKDGKPDGMPEDFLTGFLDADENAQGRPVGVTVDQHGALLVADDVGNNIWRVSAAVSAQPLAK